MNQIINQLGEAPKEEGKKGFFNILSAGKKALDAFKNSKGGAFERLGLAWKAFFDGIKGIEAEKKDATDKTQAAAGQVINTSMEELRTAASLPADAKESEKKAFDVLLASTKASFEDLDAGHQGFAQSAFNKFEKLRKGEAIEDPTVDEMTSFTAVGLGTLKRLKEQNPDKAKFQEELTKLYSISEKSKFPLDEVFGEKLLGLFKMKDEDEGLKLLGMFGITWSVGDVNPLAEGDAEEAKRNLMALGEEDFDGEKKEETVAFLGKHIFPATYASGKEKVEELATKINLLATKKINKIEAGMLSDIIFTIADGDIDRLIQVFSGKEAK